jgi:hypothetical protein
MLYDHDIPILAGLKRRLMVTHRLILVMMKNGLGKAHQQKTIKRVKLILLQEKACILILFMVQLIRNMEILDLMAATVRLGKDILVQ